MARLGKRRRAQQLDAFEPAPAKPTETKFIRILKRWRAVRINKTLDGVPWSIACFVSPSGHVYRYADSWERPDLVVDSPIMPAGSVMRYKLVGNTETIKAVRAQLAEDIKLQQQAARKRA